MDITEEVNKIIIVDCDIEIYYFYRKNLNTILEIKINELQKVSYSFYNFLNCGLSNDFIFKDVIEIKKESIETFKNNIINMFLNEMIEILYKEDVLIKDEKNEIYIMYDLYQHYLSSTEVIITGDRTIKTYSDGYKDKTEDEQWTIIDDIDKHVGLTLLIKARDEGKNNLTDNEINELRGEKISWRKFRELIGMPKSKPSTTTGYDLSSGNIKLGLKKCIDISAYKENINDKNYLMTYNLLIRKTYETDDFISESGKIVNDGDTTVPESCHAWRIFKNNTSV